MYAHSSSRSRSENLAIPFLSAPAIVFIESGFTIRNLLDIRVLNGNNSKSPSRTRRPESSTLVFPVSSKNSAVKDCGGVETIFPLIRYSCAKRLVTIGALGGDGVGAG